MVRREPADSDAWLLVLTGPAMESVAPAAAVTTPSKVAAPRVSAVPAARSVPRPARIVPDR
jgi:hypothetical protein